MGFCVQLEDSNCESNCEPIRNSSDYLRRSIYENKETVYGAFPELSESVLVFEGVPQTYELTDDEGLDQWHIPFFVVLGLVILGVCIGLYFSFRSTPEEEVEEEDNAEEKKND